MKTFSAITAVLPNPRPQLIWKARMAMIFILLLAVTDHFLRLSPDHYSAAQQSPVIGSHKARHSGYYSDVSGKKDSPAAEEKPARLNWYDPKPFVTSGLIFLLFMAQAFLRAFMDRSLPVPEAVIKLMAIEAFLLALAAGMSILLCRIPIIWEQPWLNYSLNVVINLFILSLISRIMPLEEKTVDS